jgi:hypothetical protein
MAIGDYLSNMFLGTAYNQNNQPDEAKKGLAELWKIYQQAYNVKPIWNGKQWVMPSGAVQRFQMLLPLIQAQISGAYGGQNRGGTQGKNDYGVLGGLVGGGMEKIGQGLMKKVGGWDGILDKVGNSIKGLWQTQPTEYSPQQYTDSISQ